MGLDMYAHFLKREEFKSNTEWKPMGVKDSHGYDRYYQGEEFYYWRKHYALHDWMRALYHAKGGDKEFNLVPVRLTTRDLQALKRAIKKGQIPSSWAEEDEGQRKYDLKFVARCQELIKQGYIVMYTSWW
jgi:hypothetical protein